MAEPAPELASALGAAARMASRAARPWWIIGSAAVVLHGAGTAVADLDLMMAPEDARAVLRQAGVAVREGTGSELFRSAVFGTIEGGALPIEVMGALCVRSESGWHEVALETREAVRVGAATLWVPSRGELIALLRRFGRDKDLARAALLEALPAG